MGRLVAPMTTVCERPLRPSISVSSCDTMRFSTSPLVFSRLGAMESISSMKIIAGAFFSASSNACLPANNKNTIYTLTAKFRQDNACLNPCTLPCHLPATSHQTHAHNHNKSNTNIPF